MIASNLAFEDLQRVLVQQRALTDAAEAHGVLVGALCAMTCSLDDWMAEILPEGRADRAGAASLRAIFDSTCGTLGDDNLAFEPLLPSDDASIGERTAALGEWCQGFLYGLGSGCVPDPAAMDAEAAEVLRDLTEISQVEADMGDDIETNEEAYAELVEFVRVGVQLIYAHLTPLRELPSPGPRESLH
ncbi:MAG: UPF0149 family protein [Steroidobacteraceae bacterium]